MHHDRRAQLFLMFHDTLSEFYIMMTLRSFGLAMVKLFLPIFIYTLRNSLMDVISFLFFFYLSIAFFFPLAGKLASKIGNGHTMLFSTPFTILFFGALYFLNPTPELIPFIAIIYGFSEAFFWMSFHAEFSAVSKENKVGREVGIYRSVFVLTSLLGPLIGGLVIAFMGFHILFALVIILILFGQIFLLFSQDIKPGRDFSFKKIFCAKHKRKFVYFAGYGASSFVGAWVWPLLVFFLFPDFIGMGAIALVVNSVAMCISFLVGIKSDSTSKINFIKIGSILHSLTILARVFVKNIGDAFLVWVLGAIFYPILDISFESFNYEKAKHDNILEYFLVREFGLIIGRMAIILILFLLVVDPMLAVFSAIGVGGVLSFLQFFVK